MSFYVQETNFHESVNVGCLEKIIKGKEFIIREKRASFPKKCVW